MLATSRVIPAPRRSIGRNEQPRKISGSFTTRILDCHVASFFRLRCYNLDLYIVTQRCQKAHQPLKRYLREFASQNLRELRLGSSESPIRAKPIEKAINLAHWIPADQTENPRAVDREICEAALTIVSRLAPFQWRRNADQQHESRCC